MADSFKIYIHMILIHRNILKNPGKNFICSVRFAVIFVYPCVFYFVITLL